MHRAFLIPEILTAILRFVDTSDLVTAGCVCRVWSEVSHDLLYHTIERDQWTHESFTRHALAKNAFRIRELHCGLYDDITSFHQGLLHRAATVVSNCSAQGSRKDNGNSDGSSLKDAGRIVMPSTPMNQLRVFEAPSVSMSNVGMVLDILKLSPGIEKLILPLSGMNRSTPDVSYKTWAVDAFWATGAVLPKDENEAQGVLAILLRVLTEELPCLRELTLRDWRLNEGELERLMTSSTLRKSLEVLDLDDTNEGQRQSNSQPVGKWQQRQQVRQYRDELLALPKERVEAMEALAASQIEGTVVVDKKKRFNQIRRLRINGFPEGPLTLFKVTRWCPFIHTLVLAADSSDASLFPRYRPPMYENLTDDEEENGEDDEGDGADDTENNQDGDETTASSHMERTLVSLAMFRDTLRAHCPQVTELVLQRIGIIHPAPFKCLLQAFAPTLVCSKLTGLEEWRGGLQRFETGEQVVLPSSVLRHLIDTVGSTLQHVVLHPKETSFFHRGRHTSLPDIERAGGTVLDLLRSCPQLVHVDVRCQFWDIEATKMVGLPPEPLYGETGTRKWACHDTLETLKCKINVLYLSDEEEETEDSINDESIKEHGPTRLCRFLDSMPRLRYRDCGDTISLLRWR